MLDLKKIYLKLPNPQSVPSNVSERSGGGSSGYEADGELSSGRVIKHTKHFGLHGRTKGKHLQGHNHHH